MNARNLCIFNSDVVFGNDNVPEGRVSRVHLAQIKLNPP
jgi:hypothetical protein